MTSRPPADGRTCQPALQTIHGRIIVNRTHGGHLIQSSASEQSVAFLERHGYGFHDGGCLDYARALCLWSNGHLTLSALTKPNDTIAQHVVATLDGRIHLDSDGAATTDELLVKMARLEAFDHLVIQPAERADLTYIPEHPPEQILLASEIRANAGKFDPAMFEASPIALKLARRQQMDVAG